MQYNTNSKYDKVRKENAHALAVENAANYLASQEDKRKQQRPVLWAKLPIKLKDFNVLPPLDVVRL